MGTSGNKEEQGNMELILAHQTGTQINVNCDGQYSHTFDLQPLILPTGQEAARLLESPNRYGHALYQALFPTETIAHHALANSPERILLIITDDNLDAIP